MKEKQIKTDEPLQHLSSHLVNLLIAEGWAYITTVVDMMNPQESVLLLDGDFRVIGANRNFYTTFKVTVRETACIHIQDLGTGQWNDPVLQKKLKEVLSKKTFLKGFQVQKTFPIIGERSMMLHAFRVHFVSEALTKNYPVVILLSIEDVTDVMIVAEKLAHQASQIESRFVKKTEGLKTSIKKSEKNISVIQNKE